MLRKCIICGEPFKCSPSDKKVTCSSNCRKKYASIRATGRKWTEQERQKLSQKAKGRNMADLQRVGIEAAKRSPKSGRFETNINAVEWHLISPDGKHYRFRSLNHWLRENCEKYFGCESDSRGFENARSGLSGAKRALLGGKYNSTTYKGWQVLPTDDDKMGNQ